MAKERTASPLGSIKNLKVLPESGPVEALVKLLATRCLTFTTQTAAAARGAARTLGERGGKARAKCPAQTRFSSFTTSLRGQ